MIKSVRAVLLIAALAVAISGATAEAGWEEIWQNLSSGETITPGVQQAVTAYNANVTFTVFDGDGIANNFTDSDTVTLSLVGGGKALNFSGNKTQLVDWAKANSSSLMTAFFGGAPERNFGGTTSPIFNVQQVAMVSELSPIAVTPEAKVSPFVPVSTKDIAIKGQYDFMTIGKEDAKAKGSSGLLNYEYRFGDDLKHSVGVAIPYRNLTIDDALDSRYQYASFLPYYKHRWYREKSMIEWSVNLAINLTYLKSDLFPDGGGYYEYGGGTGVKYAYQLTPALDVNAGLAYQGTKRQIPSSLVPDELKWVADAMNDLPFEHDLVPSLGFVWKVVPQKFSLRGDVFRIHQLQSGVESGYRNQTVVIGMATVNVGRLAQVTAGYKRSFEVKDVTDQSVIAMIKFGW